MYPFQVRLIALSCVALTLCIYSAVAGTRATKEIAAAIVGAWAVTVTFELVRGSSFAIAFAGDMAYAIVLVGIAW
ncbi:MAG: hypothetical protein P3W87_007650, partial [Gammaproteobacteria bacterium]|nr:hypothetical protein [Gammaproteobacteria bacterium]